MIARLSSLISAFEADQAAGRAEKGGMGGGPSTVMLSTYSGFGLRVDRAGRFPPTFEFGGGFCFVCFPASSFKSFGERDGGSGSDRLIIFG